MAYARWSDSDWYIFWNANSPKDRDSQMLSVWWTIDKMHTWTYAELREFDLYEDELLISSIRLTYECSVDDAIECIGHMRDFLQDVDNEFCNQRS